MNPLKQLALAAIVSLAVVLGVSKLPAVTPPPSGQISLLWNEATADLTTNAVFKVYWSTNIAQPLSTWTVIRELAVTNLTSTNFVVPLLVIPGANFFAVTYSNFWGESPFSNVASTPALPRFDVPISITRTN